MNAVYHIKKSCLFRRLGLNLSVHMNYFKNDIIKFMKHQSFSRMDFQLRDRNIYN